MDLVKRSMKIKDSNYNNFNVTYRDGSTSTKASINILWEWGRVVGENAANLSHISLSLKKTPEKN